MDIYGLLVGVLGGALLVGVAYLVLQLLQHRQSDPAPLMTNTEIASRVDELGEQVEKLLKVYRSTQMKNVRKGSQIDTQEAAPAVTGGDRKAELRLALFKRRMSGEQL